MFSFNFSSLFSVVCLNGGGIEAMKEIPQKICIRSKRQNIASPSSTCKFCWFSLFRLVSLFYFSSCLIHTFNAACIDRYFQLRLLEAFYYLRVYIPLYPIELLIKYWCKPIIKDTDSSVLCNCRRHGKNNNFVVFVVHTKPFSLNLISCLYYDNANTSFSMPWR